MRAWSIGCSMKLTEARVSRRRVSGQIKSSSSASLVPRLTRGDQCARQDTFRGHNDLPVTLERARQHFSFLV